jgi:hypothetical protein
VAAAIVVVQVDVDPEVEDVQVDCQKIISR